MPSAKYEIRRKCEECGAVFIAKTLESHYCNKACTQKAYNRRKAENKKREQVDAILSTVSNYCCPIKKINHTISIFNLL